MTHTKMFKAEALASGTAKRLFTAGAVAIALGASIQPSKAQLLFYEGFNYSTGSLAGDTNPGNGASWSAGNGGYSTSVTSPGLTYQDGYGNNLAVSGNAASGYLGYYGGNGIAVTTPTQSTFYVSFLSMNQNGDNEYLNFTLSNGTSTEGLGIWDDNGTWGAYLQGSGGTSLGSTTLGTTDTGASLGVFKISASGTSLSITSYIDPAQLGVQPTATASDTLTANISGIDSITGIGTSGGFYSSLQPIDEIRIGDTFADVTPIAGAVPEPSTWALMFGGLLGLLGIQRIRRSGRSS